MRKRTSKLFIISLIVIGILCVVLLIIFRDKLNTAEGNKNTALQNQIEDWSLYKQNDEVQVGAGKCGNTKFEVFLDQANSGERRILYLNDTLQLITTPNYNHWTNEDFLAFLSDESAFCSAGGIYPLKAYPDRLLWRGVCTTGKIPDEGTREYADYQKCIEAEKILDIFEE